METNVNTVDYAKKKDQEDHLAKYRDEFYIGDKIYLDGNSLGLLSKRAEHTLMNVFNAWKEFGIDGWMKGDHPWFYMSEQLGEKMAPLVGASPSEVIVTGSTTINIHQLVATFYKPTKTRYKILADDATFPSDIYALKSQIQMKGYEPAEALVRVKSNAGLLDEKDIIDQMSDDIALIFLPSVLYRSGQILNMEKVTKGAHKRGILIGFDLCHSIGAIPHSLDAWDVDFAVWCNYKHINGGPGAVAGLYVNQKHFGQEPGLAGWFSSRKDVQFDMSHDLEADVNAGAYEIGTPHVLSMAPLLGSLELFNEVGIENIRKKSLELTDYFIELIDLNLKQYDFSIASPLEKDKRGAHILLEHVHAASICKALKSHQIIPDFRAPNFIRLGPVALYNSFYDIWKTVDTLKNIMKTEEYKKFNNTRDIIA
ncbi:kynureninase [Halalkalibacter alkaliphilus]|uniref:Kynureninase n=1 Tax=Halalkalibacter alkaliphilus TaxID=2917993 RepID=A0A9X2CUQ2_9BACI|nr:kynureninase [Halalkalibacter alkaliphilus]MCL7748561.1 kynureninase [Halalkalibacter alkaliphilus]